jgi:hypothetical protein
MLQFNKSLATNTNAAYLDTVNTGSGYYGQLKIQYSQSYDQSNGTFDVTATSLPTQYNNWILFSNSGSNVPVPSGQYDVALYTATGSIIEDVWGTFSPTWTATSQTWSELTGSDTSVLVDLLYSDRAFISGSNESSITTYVSQNENGTYITYNG